MGEAHPSHKFVRDGCPANHKHGTKKRQREKGECGETGITMVTKHPDDTRKGRLDYHSVMRGCYYSVFRGFRVGGPQGTLSALLVNWAPFVICRLPWGPFIRSQPVSLRTRAIQKKGGGLDYHSVMGVAIIVSLGDLE